MERLGRVPYSIRDVFKICLRLVFLYISINLVGYIILKLNRDLRYTVNIVSNLGMYCFGMWYIVRKIGLISLGIRWNRWITSLFKAVLFYVGFIPILFILAYVGLVFCYIFGITPEPHPLVEILKEGEPTLYIFHLLITAIFIAPVFEEILFRGLFYQVLKKQLGYIEAMVISSGFFSLLHFNVSQFLPVMGLGILLCFVFEYTGSLIPVIFLHMLNNGIFIWLFFILKEHM